MPLPNANVLIALLEQYKLKRDSTWKTPIQTAINNAAKWWYGQDIPGDRKNQCDNLTEQFKNANSVEDWVNVIDEIAQAITSAEGHLWLSSTSLLAETLHAIRSYIVFYLRYVPIDDETLENTLEIFEAAIQPLKVRLEKQEKAVKVALASTVVKIESVQHYIDIRNASLIKLAYLGDEDAITRAKDVGAFNKNYRYGRRDDYPYLNTDSSGDLAFNESTPLYLQAMYFLIFYYSKLQADIGLSFDKFEENVERKSLNKQTNIPYLLVEKARMSLKAKQFVDQSPLPDPLQMTESLDDGDATLAELDADYSNDEISAYRDNNLFTRPHENDGETTQPLPSSSAHYF